MFWDCCGLWSRKKPEPASSAPDSTSLRSVIPDVSQHQTAFKPPSLSRNDAGSISSARSVQNPRQRPPDRSSSSSVDIEPFGSKKRVNTFSPKFGNAVKVIVVTKFGTYKHKDTIALQPLSSIEKTYKYIEGLSKGISEKYWIDRDEHGELSLLQGSCLIACGGRTRCQRLLEKRTLESQEDWSEIETLVDNYEKGDGQHTDLRILITRKLTLTKKPLTMADIPPMDNLRRYLWRSLKNKVVESKFDSPLRYIPKEELQLLISADVVRGVVKEAAEEFSGSEDIDELANKIFRQASTLLAMFVYYDKAPLGLLESMMNNGINDSTLPLLDFPNWLKETPNVDDQIYYKDLQFDQWMFKAVEFNILGAHQKLRDSEIVPFLEKKEYARGAFSVVYKVRLHKSHQQVYHLPPHEYNPELALKVINSSKSTAAAAFMNERFVVNGLQEVTHDHIIRLLQTYEHKGVYHFLFPLAECCLEKLMEENPRHFNQPNSSHFKKYTAWVIEQFEGIASGLEKIHVSSSTSHIVESKRLLDATTAADRRRPDGTGYHHDIKPPNLLLFRQVADINVSKYGILQIADFGIGKFHSKQSGSGTKTFRGTETYASPETRIPREMERNGSAGAKIKLSRPHDVWSLGCVLMEVLVWIVLGTKGWEKFNQERMGPIEEDEAIESDGYFFITNSKPKTAQVRPVVRDWMEKLRRHPLLANEKGCLAGLLNLVEKVLNVHPDNRPRASQLKERLGILSEVARREYLDTRGGDEGPDSDSSNSSTPTVIVDGPDSQPSSSITIPSSRTSRSPPPQPSLRKTLGKTRHQTIIVDGSREASGSRRTPAQLPRSPQDSLSLQPRPASSPRQGQLSKAETWKSRNSISSLAVQPTTSHPSQED